jgi:hypothetical protein
VNNSRFFNIGLPQLPQNTDPKLEPDLRDLYSALRNLSYLVGQYGGFEVAEDGLQKASQVRYTAGAYKRRLYCEALEVIPYGAGVNLIDTAGTITARFANATTNTRPCYGINNTPGTCAIGDIIEVALPGCYVTSIGGLVPGTRYFLSTVDGTFSNAAPAAVGNARQAVGFAFDANTFYFFPDIGWWTI